MKSRTTVILLIITLLLFGYIYYFERKIPTTEETKKAKKKVFSLLSKDIITLELKALEEHVVCKKINNTWEFVKPFKYKVAEEAITGILSEIEYLETSRVIKISATEELANFGLKNPRFSIFFTAKDQPYNIKIGNDTELGNNIYLSKNNDNSQIFVVSKSFLENLAQTLVNLRDRNLIFEKPENITDIEIRYLRNHLHFKKTDSLAWNILKPLQVKGDYEAIEQLLSQLKEIKVDKFISGKKDDDYGMLNPSGEITIRKKDRIIEKILIGNLTETTLFCQKSNYDSILSLKPNLCDLLSIGVTPYRSKALSSIYAFESTELEIKNQNKTLLLKKDIDSKDKEHWKIIKDKEAIEANIEKVREFFNNLREIKIKEFTIDNISDFSKYGLDQQQASIFIKTNDINRTKEILIGNEDPENNTCYVKFASENSVYKVSADIVKLSQTLDTFFSKKEEEIIKDKITTNGGETHE